MPTTRPARVSRYVAGLGAAALVATGLASAGAAFGADDRPAGQFTEITRVDGVDAGGSFSVTTTTVGGVPVLPGPTLSGATTDPQSTGLARLAGSSRYETAVAVSRRAFAAGQARSVYLARGDRLGDALAGGSLTDGPVLLVPPSGPVPQLVLDEVRRLGASEVVAIGGSVSASTLSAVAQGAPPPGSRAATTSGRPRPWLVAPSRAARPRSICPPRAARPMPSRVAR